MSNEVAAPRGTIDILPPASSAFLAARAALVKLLPRAGYSYIETPVFEDTALFRRGVGESTDVVSKEMYTFEDKGGRSLTLRPELTAGLMRAVIQHRLYAGQLPVKLYTVGQNFRYERPQAGRYRNFTQVNMEAIGVDDPALDAEVVALGAAGFRAMGLQNFSIWLTSLGDRACRPAYREKLQAYLGGLDLDEETRRRAAINPLRVLDDKRPELQSQLAEAPLMVDHLCDNCRVHYDQVREHLTDLGVSWVEAPRMVRGLDYYTKTTFEYVHGGLGAQASIGGGGRYDGLSEALGGPDLSGVGYAIGVERTLLAAEAEDIELASTARCQVFVVSLGTAARRRAVVLVDEFRRAGVDTDMAYGDRGLKGAMKAADRSGARLAVIIGDRDLEGASAQLRDLADGEQVTVPLADLVTTVKEKLS